MKKVTKYNIITCLKRKIKMQPRHAQLFAKQKQQNINNSSTILHIACWQFCLSLNNNDLLLLKISQTSTNSNITNNSDNRVFSHDVTKFKIFLRKLPPPCWCPFEF